MPRPTKVSAQVSYKEIVSAILEEIRSGVIESGSLLPTERELTDRFNASRSVVRRALAEVVDTGWGEAIPNKGVVAVLGRDRTRTQNIAFIDHRSNFNRHLYVSLSVRLQQLGNHLVLIDSQDLGVEGALEYACNQNFAAAFVWSKKGYPDPERVRTVANQMPIVALDHCLIGTPCDLVTDDNFGGAWTATKHLADTGHRRIAISGMYDMTETMHDRFGGYLQAQFDAGLQPFPSDFLFSATSGDISLDTRLLAHRLTQSDRPDAVFVLQDEAVIHVVEAIHDAGLRIPEDVAIAAFREDVIPAFGEAALTTVAVDWDQYAMQCVERLSQRIARPNLPPETFRLPTHLRVRGSCGAPRSMWVPSVNADPPVAISADCSELFPKEEYQTK